MFRIMSSFDFLGFLKAVFVVKNAKNVKKLDVDMMKDVTTFDGKI